MDRVARWATIHRVIKTWIRLTHTHTHTHTHISGSSVIKNPPANSGDARDAGSIPGSRRSPGEGNGNLLQYSHLENPMDRGARWVAKNQTRFSE